MSVADTLLEQYETRRNSPAIHKKLLEVVDETETNELVEALATHDPNGERDVYVFPDGSALEWDALLGWSAHDDKDEVYFSLDSHL